jgi:hypothetical protein
MPFSIEISAVVRPAKSTHLAISLVAECKALLDSADETG